MNWLSKHTDAVIVLGAIISSMVWMNTKFNGIDARFNELEKDISTIKTVLIMKEIMPRELACKERE